MRSPNITLLHETMSSCFDQVLSSLGDGTKRVVYDSLAKRGIERSDISSRFEEVGDALVRLFGEVAKALQLGMLTRLCEEYSVPLNLDYADSLGNRLRQLSEYILMQRLTPKHFRQRLETTHFEDKLGEYAPWTD